MTMLHRSMARGMVGKRVIALFLSEQNIISLRASVPLRLVLLMYHSTCILLTISHTSVVKPSAAGLQTSSATASRVVRPLRNASASAPLPTSAITASSSPSAEAAAAPVTTTTSG